MKSSILLAGTCERKISSVACGLFLVKIHFSDYLKNLIIKIHEDYLYFNKISLRQYFIENNINFIYNCLCCCNQTCYCVGMVSVTSASRNVTSASRYQSRSTIYIRGLI